MRRLYGPELSIRRMMEASPRAVEPPGGWSSLSAERDSAPERMIEDWRGRTLRPSRARRPPMNTSHEPREATRSETSPELTAHDQPYRFGRRPRAIAPYP